VSIDLVSFYGLDVMARALPGTREPALGARLTDYRTHLRPRSAKWRTVRIPAKAFTDLAHPLKELL